PTRTLTYPLSLHDALPISLEQLTHLMVQAQYPVELALEMKIGAWPDGVIEDAVLEWLQRWGWDAATGTLMPDGEATDVSVSIMRDRKSTRLNSSHVSISYA